MRTKLPLLLPLALLFGCGGGPSLEPVTGVVQLDGKAISGAVVTFQPVEGGTGTPAVGTTDSTGKYTITDLKSDNIGGGATIGDYNVGVVWVEPSADDSSNSTGDSGETTITEDDRKSRQETVGPDSLLPTVYNNPKTSGLKASVTSGGGSFDFPLDSNFKGEGK